MHELFHYCFGASFFFKPQSSKTTGVGEAQSGCGVVYLLEAKRHGPVPWMCTVVVSVRLLVPVWLHVILPATPPPHPPHTVVYEVRETSPRPT